MPKIYININVLLFALVLCGAALSNPAQACPETLNFTKKTLAGDETVNLCEKYLGKVVLVVNTASNCGYTYQYEGLEDLYKNYRNYRKTALSE